MQYAVAALALAAAVSAQTGSGGLAAPGLVNPTDFQATQFETFTVSAYVTTCPANVGTTSFAYNGVTYSGTANQVITVTNCPCVITAKAGTVPSGATIVTAPQITPAPTAPSTGIKVPAGAGNGTVQKPEEFQGAANKLTGAGLAAVFALAAYAL